MREVKFRVWDIYKKVFIPTDCFAIQSTDFSAFGVMLKDWEDYKKDEYLYSTHQIVSQYTGLRDRNGSEIYEGDILEYTQHLFNTSPDRFPIKRKEVAWNKHNGSWNIYNTNAGESDLIVIGNIYENNLSIIS